MTQRVISPLLIWECYFKIWRVDSHVVSGHKLFRWIEDSGNDYRDTWDELKFWLEINRVFWKRLKKENDPLWKELRDFCDYLGRDLSQAKKVYACREAGLEAHERGGWQNERDWREVWDHPNPGAKQKEETTDMLSDWGLDPDGKTT